MKNIINRAFMAKKKILFVLAAVMFCAASTSADCVYNRTTGVIKIYKSDGSLKGGFSVSGAKKVKFAQGNLQYNSDKQKWQFAAHQYDFIGNAGGNVAVTEGGLANGNGVADLFGWVGASSTWIGLKQYGLTSASSASIVAGDGYGNGTENLRSDWGGLMGAGWRTLTANEWNYVLWYRNNLRSTIGEDRVSFVKATVNGVCGLLLFPDDGSFATSEFTLFTAASIDNKDVGFGTVTCNLDQWEALESKGCVFLPAAGKRNGATVSVVGTEGSYWAVNGYGMYGSRLYLTSSDLKPDQGAFQASERNIGWSVRLVKDVVVTP